MSHESQSILEKALFFIKVIIEKSRCGRFFMEQELRFGLDLGRLEILKKRFGPIMSNFLGRVVQVLWEK